MTPTTPEMPNVRPSGLVTVAYLKAQLDEGNDHLGIFMPLVLDVIGQMPSGNFTTGEIQESLHTRHGVVMPQHTLTTLLKRAVAKNYLTREAGRYFRKPGKDLPPSNVAVEKSQIEEGQQRLGESLRAHAEKRGLKVESTELAIEMLLKFLETARIGLLLDTSSAVAATDGENHRERTVVAEFLYDLIQANSTLTVSLRRMLEGLVLYNAAFLPDLGAVTRHFTNLRVVFDSSLVRQALGYEGEVMSKVMRETLDVLRASGIQCLVFDKTIAEIRRILSAYEHRLARHEQLKPLPMARYVLTQRYSPSDLREMSALLEQEVQAVGFLIRNTPSRRVEFTAGERSLTQALTDPNTKDELEPRVVHDVDCIAGVLTLLRGHRSAILENARVVFVTTSARLIRNIRIWWEEEEHETGAPPQFTFKPLRISFG